MLNGVAYHRLEGEEITWSTVVLTPMQTGPRGIYSMAFNPSGSLLACGFGNGRLHWLRFPQLQPLAAPVRCGRERLAALAFVGDWWVRRDGKDSVRQVKIIIERGRALGALF